MSNYRRDMNLPPAKSIRWLPIIPKVPRCSKVIKGNGFFDAKAMCKGQSAQQSAMRRMEAKANRLDRSV